MASAFTTCLFFSCLFLDRWKLGSLQGKYPKPSLRITSGNVTVTGENLTMTCTGLHPNMKFSLYRGTDHVLTQEPPGIVAVFHFTDVQEKQEGEYSCFFRSKVSQYHESERSETVEVKLRDYYPKPSVTLSPGSVVKRGGNVTIHCAAEYPNMRFVLYKEKSPLRHTDPSGNEAVFVISGAEQKDAGSYQCRYHSLSSSTVWSDGSDYLRIQVHDLSKPSISYEPVQGAEGDYKINCSTLQDMTVNTFFLYKDGVQAPRTDRRPSTGIKRVMFPISGVDAKDGTEYRCSYQISESGEFVISPLSDPIKIGKDNKQERNTATTLGDYEKETSTATTPGTMDPTTTIAVVCAVLLLVILVVTLVLYIKCRPKKAKGDIQNRNLPLNEEKAEAVEPMYAVINNVKATKTIVPEVKKQEEDGYDEGLTYAIINKNALKSKTKNSAPPSQVLEPTLYAAVNVH